MAEALTASFRDAVALSASTAGARRRYLNVAVTNGRRAVVSRVTTDRPETPSRSTSTPARATSVTDGKPS